MFRTWPSTYAAMRFGALKPGDRSLAQSNPFLLRHSRKNSNYGFLKYAGAVEKLLGKRSVVDSVAGEPLQVVQRFHGTLAAQPVKRPEEQAVELTPGRGREHLLELVTVPVFAAGLILVLVNDSPALGGRELPKLAELVFRVLPTVSGGDSCICSDSHHCLPCAENERYLSQSKWALNPTPNEPVRRPVSWYRPLLGSRESIARRGR